MKSIKNIAALIRIGNLVFIATIAYVLQIFAIAPLVENYQEIILYSPLYNHRILFMLMVLSSLLIAAAAYVINDISDIKADRINKPQSNKIDLYFGIQKGKVIYHALNSLGLLIGFITFWLLGKPSLFVVDVLVSMMLYLYAIKYQYSKLLGTVFVSFSAALLIGLVALFEYYYVLISGLQTPYDSQLLQIIIAVFFVFVFLTTFLREWVKDLEDLQGDQAIGSKNLMCVLGIKKGSLYIKVLSLIFLAFLVLFNLYLYSSQISPKYFNFYFSALILLFVFLLLPKIFRAQKKSDFSQISLRLKIFMALGLISIVLLNIT